MLLLRGGGDPAGFAGKGRGGAGGLGGALGGGKGVGAGVAATAVYVLLPVSGAGSWNCSFFGAWGASRGGAGGVVGVAGAAGLSEVGMMLTGVGGVILVGG